MKRAILVLAGVFTLLWLGAAAAQPAATGGGVMVHMTGLAWFRADMKFGFSPGTSLYLGFGFTWRL